MKAKHADQAKRLEEIPNIGKAIAEDRRRLGISRSEQLKNNDDFTLYNKLNAVTGERHDPCVADTFLAAVDFMNGGKPLPW